MRQLILSILWRYTDYAVVKKLLTTRFVRSFINHIAAFSQQKAHQEKLAANLSHHLGWHNRLVKFLCGQIPQSQRRLF